MNKLKRGFLILTVIGFFALNLGGRIVPEVTDGSVIIEQDAGDFDEWTDPVF